MERGLFVLFLGLSLTVAPYPVNFLPTPLMTLCLRYPGIHGVYFNTISANRLDLLVKTCWVAMLHDDSMS